VIGAPTLTDTVAAVTPDAPVTVIVVVPDSSGVTVNVPAVDPAATVATAGAELIALKVPI
jgi:hypothetical protein